MSIGIQLLKVGIFTQVIIGLEEIGVQLLQAQVHQLLQAQVHQQRVPVLVHQRQLVQVRVRQQQYNYGNTFWRIKKK